MPDEAGAVAADRADAAAPAPEASAEAGPFAALAYPGFRLILVGTFFAFGGYWTFLIAQGWVVLELTDSPFMVGMVSAFADLPFLFVSILGGVLADRVDRRRASMLARAFTASMMLLQAVLYFAGALEVWMMMAIAFTAGIGFALDNPIRQSMVPDVVPARHLSNAIAVSFASNSVTNIVGPGLGGLLLATAGAGWSFTATAAGNLVLFGCYALIRLPPRRPATDVSVAGQLKEGLGFVRRDEVLFILILAAAFTSLVQPYQRMMPVFVRDELGLGSAALGAMSAVPGVGAVLGALAVAMIGARARKGRLLLAGAACAAGSLMLFSQAPSLPVALPVLATIGISNAFFMTMNNTIVLQRAPAHLRGRVVSAMIVVWGLSPVGSTLMGLLASVAGVRLALAATAGAALVVTALVALRRPVLRSL